MLQKNAEPAKLITLLELFEGRKFEVPDYQRGFSWDEEQVIDLLTDIEMHNSKSGHKHFTGTIVVERPNGGDTFQIVDGQQRLVTCVMILRAIVEINPRKLKGIEAILTKSGREYETAITLGDQDENYFNKSILNVSKVRIKTASNRRLKEGYKLIYGWAKRNSEVLNDLFKTLTSGIGFIFFETTSEKETTTMFEVINNRGKELSELEKFKNLFIHIASLGSAPDHNLIERIKISWSKILENLEIAGVESIHEENRFVNHCFEVLFAGVNSERENEYFWYRREIYSFLRTLRGNTKAFIKKSLTEEIESIFDYTNFLELASLTYAFLFNHCGHYLKKGGNLYSSELDEIFKKLRNHGSLSNSLPLVLSLMYLYFKFPAQRAKIVKVMKVVEVLNFRVYCLPSVVRRTDAKKSEMLNIASIVYEGAVLDGKSRAQDEYDTEVKKDDYYSTINNQLVSIIQKNCPEEKFIQSLTLDSDETYDYFSWKSMEFFLAKYEHNLMKNDPTWDYEKLLLPNSEGDSERLSKEHILALKNKDLFTSVADIQKRRLGNFMLVGENFNRRLGTKGVSEKVEYIKKHTSSDTRLRHVNEVVLLFDQIINFLMREGNNNKQKKQRIIQKLFDLRETNMIKFALKEWAYPGEPKPKFQKVDTLQAEKEKRKSRYYPDYDKMK